MQAGQSSHVFTIAAPRDFFAAWLAPRLAAYRAANPDVRYALVDGEMTDFTEANLDLAVRWIEGPGDLEGVQIGRAELVTVSSQNGGDDWIAWPGDTNPGGAGTGALSPLMVGDAGQALSAAAAGMGQARVPALLAEGLADRQNLVAGPPEPCRRAYWLVAPLPQWRQKKVKALVAHLTES
jgi:LysR family glycine cleavage system transcriptional activator